MATLARWQQTIVDGNGNVQPGASVEVRRDVPGQLLASLFSDRAGTALMPNPFTSDGQGLAAFHVVGGVFQIVATLGAFSRTLRYVGIGTAAELDSDTFSPTAGVRFTFDTATADADPGNGDIRFNNATLASATAAYIDNLNKDGSDVSSLLDTFDDAGHTGDRGLLHVFVVAAAGTAYRFYRVTGSVVDGTGYRKLTLQHVNGAGSFAASDTLSVVFYPRGAGDVTGPASATNNNFPQFDGASGKLIKDGGISLDVDTALAANSDLRIASQKAVKAYVDGIIAAQDAMVFQGVIDASGNPNYPAASRGHTYRISVAGKIGGASGPNVEAGDIIICLTDGTAAGNHATVGANWGIIQVNIDGAVVGPASATDFRVALFDGATGKLIKQSVVSIDANSDVSGVRHLTLTGYIDISEQSTPANPAANVARLYARDDGGTTKVYFKDNAGAETNLGGAGGGAAIVPTVELRTTSATITIPVGATKCKVTLVGGGGGGGGEASGVLGRIGGPGGGGATCIKYLSGLTPGNTLALTVNTGGGGGSGTAVGAAGGSVVLASGTQSITTLTAGGGGGGAGAAVPALGAGGTATNGDLNITGGRGQSMLTTSPTNKAATLGGSSTMGAGGAVLASADSAGGAGSLYGGGGSGGVGFTAGGNGGAGANGCAIFEWYA